MNSTILLYRCLNFPFLGHILHTKETTARIVLFSSAVCVCHRYYNCVARLRDFSPCSRWVANSVNSAVSALFALARYLKLKTEDKTIPFQIVCLNTFSDLLTKSILVEHSWIVSRNLLVLVSQLLNGLWKVLELR